MPAMVPGVLLAARHAKNDLPAEMLTLARWRQRPGVVKIAENLARLLSPLL